MRLDDQNGDLTNEPIKANKFGTSDLADFQKNQKLIFQVNQLSESERKRDAKKDNDHVTKISHLNNITIQNYYNHPMDIVNKDL